MTARGIQAAVVDAAGAPFAIEPLRLEDPREGEVLVTIEAAGLCHTDLSVADGHFGTPFPMVLGHESAGTVEAVGLGVRGLSAGDKVVMSFNFCGDCRNCRSGRPAYCYEMWERNFEGHRVDGTTSLARGSGPVHSHFLGQSAFATQAVCPVRSVTRIDSDIPFSTLAPFGCGVQTGAGAVMNVLRPRPSDAIAVFGAGAVGLAAVMASALQECRTIVVVEPDARRRALACALGATHALDPGAGDVVERIREISPPGVEYTLEISGHPSVLQQAVSALAPGGTCGVIGAPPMGVTFSMDVHEVLDTGRTIRGIVMGDSVPQRFLPVLVDRWERGELPVDRLVETFPFERIADAVGAARSGRVVKPVLVMR